LNILSGKPEINSPAAGTIQGIRNIYPGDFCPLGRQVCMLVPIQELWLRCYSVQGYWIHKAGMKTRFKIDAFDYKYWGFLEGKCISIAKDYEIVGNLPLFRVICQLIYPVS